MPSSVRLTGINYPSCTIISSMEYTVFTEEAMMPALKVHRLRVFENRVLRRISELKKDQIIAGWRKLHNEKLHNLY
jgi:hypothetical protein